MLSSLWTSYTIAALAVDGNRETSNCAETGFEGKPWLRVDLQATAVVQSVIIVSREAKYRHMEEIDVRAGSSFQDGGVGNPPCQLNIKIPANSSTVHVQCPLNMIARYVTVNGQESDCIEICEMEVYGYYV